MTRAHPSNRSVALIRGINVSKSTQISMPVLKSIFERSGCSEVSTLLRSGNVIFQTDRPYGTLKLELEDELSLTLGLAAKVALVRAATLETAISSNPLSGHATDEARSIVGFPTVEMDIPTAITEWKNFEGLGGPGGKATISNGLLYLWCPTGVSNAPGLSYNWEAHLGTALTFRNFQTLRKIALAIDRPTGTGAHK